MLNKDEYNQEEYNDYYRQEIQGAELNDLEKDENEGRGKLIWILLLVALAAAGYFGYTMMNSSDEELDTSLQVSMESLPQSIESETQNDNEPTEEESSKVEIAEDTPKVTAVQESSKIEVAEKTLKEETPKSEAIQEPSKVEIEQQTPKENNVQNDISTKVQKAVDSSSGKMSPEEVAAIVAAVMKQMNQEKNDSVETTPSVTKQDKELLNSLSTTDVDSISGDLEEALENTNISEDTHIDNSAKQVDVYNKVNVQNVKGTDSLSQLSEQITQEIEDAKVSSTTTTTNEEDKEYSTDIKKEVVFREKEMRIIIVRKGDTLGKLAKRAYGNVMEFRRIYQANPEITRPDRIYIGQKIRIPN